MDLSTVLDKACCTPRLKVADKTALLRHLAAGGHGAFGGLGGRRG